MAVITRKINLQSRGNGETIDITARVASELAEADISDGTATIFITGSTASITTIEFEPGLVADFRAMWQRTVPSDIPYDHNQRWHDDNGYSHVRASLLGASLVIPFRNRSLALGTWQQIVVIDFDNRPRSREIVLQFMGE